MKECTELRDNGEECPYLKRIFDPDAPLFDADIQPLIVDGVRYPSFPKNVCNHPSRLQEDCVVLEGTFVGCGWFNDRTKDKI